MYFKVYRHLVTLMNLARQRELVFSLNNLYVYVSLVKELFVLRNKNISYCKYAKCIFQNTPLSAKTLKMFPLSLFHADIEVICFRTNYLKNYEVGKTVDSSP